MPVIVLAGDEDFELKRRLKKLKDSLVDPTWASFNLSTIDRPNLVDVCDSALTVPFGQGNKVIVFENCDLFTKKKSGGAAKASAKPSASKTTKQLEYLDEVLGSVAENTYLIFSCPFNFDSTLKTSKIVSKHAEKEDFPKAKFYVGSHNPQLETWVRKEAHRYKATIDDDAITYLLDGTEANLRQIANELEKAATYILPNKHITLEVVEEMSPYHSHVFTMLDFWLKGQSHRVLDSVEELLSRQPAIQIMATLQTFLSRWIEMKSICEEANHKLPHGPGIQKRELPLPEQVKRVSSHMKMRPFVVEKDLKRLKNWRLERLVAKKEMLTRFETNVKTGLMHDRNALELFLID